MKEEDNLQEEENEELFEHYRIVVDQKQSLIRIDKFLMDRIPNATRNKVQNAIRDEYIKVNEQLVKANYKTRPGDVITVSLPQPPRETEILPENIPLNIVHEDEYLVVVNKPAGMVVHPAHQNWTGTLVNALAYHFQHLPSLPDNEGRPGLVHRIDKDTSGLLVIAKHDKALQSLARQFFDHSIERTYYALVWGEVAEDKGTVDVHIGRSLKDRRVVVPYPQGDMGRHAITHYQVLERLRYVSLVKCNLETGRTHQIRAHMRYLGHPLFNDATYGGDQILKGTKFSKYKSFIDNCFKILPRQALHAKTLGFVHPQNQQPVSFDSELPVDFQALLEKWRNYVHYT